MLNELPLDIILSRLTPGVVEHYKTMQICTFDVDNFLDKVFAKYEKLSHEYPYARSWSKTRDELRALWDKVLDRNVTGDASLYPNQHGPQPALMEVWLKSGDFWRAAGNRRPDKFLCNQHGIPLHKWEIQVINHLNQPSL